jgi:hypothetical protein
LSSGRSSSGRSTCRLGRCLAGGLAVVLGLSPALSLAIGSPLGPRIESVPELIVEGDRPEISACLYSAQLAATRGPEFARIRWSPSVSDESLVREYRRGDEWTRVTTFEASALTQGRWWLFSKRRWVEVRVECRQVNEKAPVVTLRALPETPAR